jgi:Na+/melibiose symporter-like transporter
MLTRCLVRSWVTFFFRSHYGIEEGKLGSIFFVTSIIAAFSTIVAASIAKRIGNVKVWEYKLPDCFDLFIPRTLTQICLS